MRYLLALLMSTGVMAQTTVVAQQDFGVHPPEKAYGMEECGTSQYVGDDCYAVKEGVLFVYNDEIEASALLKVDLADGYYHSEVISEYLNQTAKN